MKYLFPLTLIIFPAIAGAATGIFDLLGLISDLIQAIVPVLIGLAVLFFIWGILRYVVAKSEDEQKEAKSIILWGVIVLFVMVSIWGLVNLLGDTLQLNNSFRGGPAVPGI